MSKKAISKEVTNWCSDALHDLLGFADASLASYLTSIARQSHSPDALLNVLVEGGCTAAADKQHTFAISLLQRVNGSNGPSAAPKRATNADWVKAASKYEMLDDEVEPVDQKTDKKKKERKKEGDMSSKAEKTEKSEPRKRQYRGANDDSESEDDASRGRLDGSTYEAETTEKRRERRKQRRSDRGRPEHERDDKVGGEERTALTAEERAELDREKDIQERDEMVKRMMDRDHGKTKLKFRTDEQDGEHHKRLDTEERLLKGETVIDVSTGASLSLERLREQSRRAYLKKREERELTLLKQSLEDEEELFKGAKLSEAEKKRIELSKQILAAVDERATKEDKHDGFYHMPNEVDEKASKADKDKALLTSRYVEPKREKTEGELWEDSQTHKATAFASRKKKATKADDYDLVFEDQIDFVMQETSKGYDRRVKKQTTKVKEDTMLQKDIPEARPITEHEKILAGRQKLPVFPYREEFLAAVKEHQILILVGETGSGMSFDASPLQAWLTLCCSRIQRSLHCPVILDQLSSHRKNDANSAISARNRIQRAWQDRLHPASSSRRHERCGSCCA